MVRSLTFGLLVSVLWMTEALAQSPMGLQDEGVGMYTDASVANQASTFTINHDIVTCGVGTVLAPEVFAGPFEMLMYSLSIDSYTIERQVPRRIVATGKMRSITRAAGRIVEDTSGTGLNAAPHDFVAIAEDNDSPQKDRFVVHFLTPFWNLSNPMCTPSELFPGLCRFGGDTFLGNITVTGQQF